MSPNIIKDSLETTQTHESNRIIESLSKKDNNTSYEHVSTSHILFDWGLWYDNLKIYCVQTDKYLKSISLFRMH
jgi:hypothetical protein